MVPRRPHPFELAQTWRQQIGTDPMLTKAKIAAREGISRARVTQIMGLLQLPAAIQKDLVCPPSSLRVHSFTERRLRLLVRYKDEAIRMRLWRELLEELGNSGRD